MCKKVKNKRGIWHKKEEGKVNRVVTDRENEKMRDAIKNIAERTHNCRREP
jgi:hypothetical protein